MSSPDSSLSGGTVGSGEEEKASPRRFPAAERRRPGRRWLVPVAAAVVLAAVVLAIAGSCPAPPPPVELEASGRVLVLPLLDTSGESEDGWISGPLAAMVSRALERTRGTEVVPAERLRKAIAARDLAADDEAVRPRVRQLALALGAELVLDATIGRRGGRRGGAGEESWEIEYRIHDRGGEVARGEVAGADPLAAADRLVHVVARGLVSDAVPARLTDAYSRSAFVDRLYALGLERLWSAGTPAAAAAAEPYFEIALRSRPRFLAARARLAECRRDLGELDSSRELTLSLLNEAQSRGERRWQLWSFRSLGRLAALEGRFDEAREHYSQAYSMLLSRDDPPRRAEVLFELARLALAGGDSARAQELLVEVLELRQNLGDSLGEADALLEIGSLFLAQDDLEGARQVLDRARRLAASLEDVWSEMRAVASLGEVARRQGDRATAAELWQQALRFYEQRGDRPRVLLLSRNLAEVVLLEKDFARAEELLHRVVELAAELDDPAFEASASLRLTWIQLRTGYPLQARSHLDRALALDRWLDDQRLEIQQMIAWLAYEQGNYQLAVATQRQARRLAGDGWTPWQQDYLDIFEQAQVRGRRFPVPGETGYRRPP